MAGWASRGTEVLADWDTWLPSEEGQRHRRVNGSFTIRKSFWEVGGRLGKAGVGWGRTWALQFGLRCLSFWFK